MKFQLRIAAMMVQDPAFLKAHRDAVQASYFESASTATIVRTVLDYFDKHSEVPDRVSMINSIRAYAYTTKMREEQETSIIQTAEALYDVSIPGMSHAREEVIKFGQTQSMKKAIFDCVDVLKKGGDVSECRELVNKATLVGHDLADLGVNVHEAMTNLPSVLQRSHEDRIRIRTNFRSLDRFTLGGPCQKEVWMVLAQSGGGKSVFLTNIGAVAIKAGIPVVHFTIGDLDEIDVLHRYAARLTGTPMHQIVHDPGAYLAKVSTKSWSLRPFYLRVKYFPSGRPTTDTLRAYLSRLKTVEGISPGLVIVDYIDELAMPSDDAYVSGGLNFQGLQQIKDDFRCLVWTASQVNRWRPQSKNDVIRMDNIADSSRKNWKADGIVTYNQTFEEYQAGVARLWIEKVRRGEKFKLINLRTEFSKMWFYESDPFTAGVGKPTAPPPPLPAG